MSDSPNADSAAVGEQEGVPAVESAAETPAAVPAAAPAPAPAANGADTAAPTAPAAAKPAVAPTAKPAESAALADLADEEPVEVPASWPENWREIITGGDEDQMRVAKRFGGLEGVWKKLLNQDKLIASGAHKVPPTLAENASPEDLAEYRKTYGIPETPDGYGIKFNPELQPTEGDNAALQGWLEHAHAKHMPPAAAKAGVEWYENFISEARDQHAALIRDAKAEMSVELRKEFGPEKNRTLGITERFLDDHGLADLIDATMPNGVPLKYHPAFKSVIAAAMKYADEDGLISGEGGDIGASFDDRLNDLTMKSLDGKLTQVENNEYQRMLGKVAAREARQRQGRAA